MDGYAVVDLETTGFSPAKHDRIVEVAVVHVDGQGQIEDEWCTLVNPQRDLGPQSVHGVRAADARRAPTFDVVAPHLAARLTGRLLVAHNLAFDALFLSAGYQRLGVLAPIDREYGLCTMRLADHYLGGSGRTLAACCANAGITHTDAHSALGDARATAALFGHYLRLAGHPPPWTRLYQYAEPGRWPDLLPNRSFLPAQRTGGHDTVPGQWLDRLVFRMPRVPDPPQADAYLAVLDRALLDRHLAEVEKDGLVSLAEELTLSRDDVVKLHGDYLTALAGLAWADGIVTDAERADLYHVAELLGLDATEVGLALSQDRQHDLRHSKIGAFRLAAGDIVVFTGEMQLSRDVWVDRAEQVGLTVSLRTVTKKTALVVAGDPDSLSGKARKARDYGIPVVSEAAFDAMWKALSTSG